MSTYWVSVQILCAFWPCWPYFGPLVATKWLKVVVSDHFVKRIFTHFSSNLVCTLIGWVFRNDLLFGQCSGHKITENCGFWPLSEKVFMQSNSNLVCSLIGWVFRIDSLLDHFGPLVATKWLKIVVSDHYVKKYSRNPVETWCVHLLGECSEIICFLATLVIFWPFSGHKMTENGGFRPLSEKVFNQSNSNLVCTLIGWVFRIDSLLDHVD